MSTNYEAQCRGRMWGVFTEPGPPSELPLALFRYKSDAVEWRESNSTGDPILRADLYVSYHNGPPGKDTKAEFEDFEPWKEDQ